MRFGYLRAKYSLNHQKTATSSLKKPVPQLFLSKYEA